MHHSITASRFCKFSSDWINDITFTFCDSDSANSFCSLSRSSSFAAFDPSGNNYASSPSPTCTVHSSRFASVAQSRCRWCSCFQIWNKNKYWLVRSLCENTSPPMQSSAENSPVRRSPTTSSYASAARKKATLRALIRPLMNSILISVVSIVAFFRMRLKRAAARSRDSLRVINISRQLLDLLRVLLK